MTAKSPGQLDAWLRIMRLSNAPTVITNVMVGAAVVMHGQAITSRDAIGIAGISIAMLAIYVAGMILNDVVDAGIDAKERPERPIPSGAISRAAALSVAIVLMIAGVVISAMFGLHATLAAAILVALVIAYDLLHKHSVFAALLMGLCRGFVYITAAVALAGDAATGWVHGAVAGSPMVVYITAVTIAARREADPVEGRTAHPLYWVLPLMIFVPLLFVPRSIARSLVTLDWGTIVMIIAMSGWITWCTSRLYHKPPRVPAAIMGWLAGICLIDAVFLAGQSYLLAMAIACFFITLLVQRRIAGT